MDRNTVNLKTNAPVCIFRGKGMPVYKSLIHRHEEMEINWVLNGKGINMVGDKTYDLNKDDILIMSNREYHHAFNISNLELLIVVFKPEYICLNELYDSGFLDAFTMRKQNQDNKIDADASVSREIRAELEKMETESKNMKPGSGLLIRACLFKVLALVNQHYMGGNTYVGRRSNNFSHERIRKAVEYIKSNFAENIKLSELTDMTSTSPANFCYHFKNAMGMSHTKYLNMVRLNHAVRLLKETDMSISEIAGACGFNETTYFNRVFRRQLKQSPGEMRKLNTVQ